MRTYIWKRVCLNKTPEKRKVSEQEAFAVALWQSNPKCYNETITFEEKSQKRRKVSERAFAVAVCIMTWSVILQMDTNLVPFLLQKRGLFYCLNHLRWKITKSFKTKLFLKLPAWDWLNEGAQQNWNLSEVRTFCRVLWRRKLVLSLARQYRQVGDSGKALLERLITIDFTAPPGTTTRYNNGTQK